MRKWGIVISVFYAVIVVGLLVPVGICLAGGKDPLGTLLSKDLIELFEEWLAWVPIVALVAGQAILLFLSVDTSFKKLKPRAHHCGLGGRRIDAVRASCFRGQFLRREPGWRGDKFLDQFWDTRWNRVGFGLRSG